MTYKRKPISKRLRFEIFKRDRFSCQYCGLQPPQTTLEIDHVIAVANGGDNSEANLLTSCIDCNRGKSDRPLAESPAQVDLKIADRIERSEQLKALNEFLISERKASETAATRLGVHWFDIYKRRKAGLTFGDSRATSIRRFLKEIPEAEILESIDIAFARKSPRTEDEEEGTWKYFCGICWSKIKERSPNGR